MYLRLPRHHSASSMTSAVVATAAKTAIAAMIPGLMEEGAGAEEVVAIGTDIVQPGAKDSEVWVGADVVASWGVSTDIVAFCGN